MNCVLSRLSFTTRFAGLPGGPRPVLLSRESVEEVVRSVCCGTAAVGVACSDTCAWHRGFLQEISADPDVVRRHQKPGNPFVFGFPQVEAATSTVCVGLTLIGSAIQDAGVYIKAVGRLCGGGPGGARVIVEALDLHGERHPLGDTETIQEANLILVSLQDVFDSVPSVRKVVLHFETPLRLFHGGRQLHRFDFPLFFRSLLRRVSSLVAYYCEGELDIDFPAVSHAAGKVCSTVTAVSSVPSRGGIAGFVGSAVLEGDLQDLLPILKAGEILHAGKGASFGYGRFRMEFPD